MDRWDQSSPGADSPRVEASNTGRPTGLTGAEREVAAPITPEAEPPEVRPLILVVDDDAAVASALAETLRDEHEVLAVTAPRAALSAMADRTVAVLIADQRMPGMGGIELLTEARRRHPDTVGVLITAHADVKTAVQAINEARAFGYLIKPWDVDELLRFVRRAVEAHRALHRDARALRERELRNLDQMSRSAPVPVTGQRFGATSLHEGLPEVFAELVDRYATLLEGALEQRVYKVDRQMSETLRHLADRLGALRAGPRDIVELHTIVLRRRLVTATAEQAEAYADEGRLLVLELMGHLVSYYRGFSLG